MRRLRTISLLAVIGTAAVVLGTDFTWTDDGTGHSWSNPENWSGPTGQYPDDTNDNATIPTTVEAGWQVDLTDESIDRLTIAANVDFSPVAAGATLSLEEFVINAPVGQTLTLTLSGSATIDVDVPAP